MAPTDTISVLIVDDHEEARRALVSRLRREANICVAGETGHPGEALAALQQNRPQVIVLDVHMQHADGLQTCAEMAATRPNIPIVVYTSYLDRQQWNQCLRAGASAHVLKDTNLENLIATILRVASRRPVRPLPAG